MRRDSFESGISGIIIPIVPKTVDLMKPFGFPRPTSTVSPTIGTMITLMTSTNITDAGNDSMVIALMCFLMKPLIG